MREPDKTDSRPAGGRALLETAALTFVVGFLAMLIPTGLFGGRPGWPTALAGAVVLTVVLVPLLHRLAGRRWRRTPAPALADDGSITDPLTRTLNRRGITIGLLDLMALADRYGHHLSVAMVDVDHLGQVNARHGKAAGDRVVAALAEVLADALRMPDRVGRYTDNEFLLVLPETRLEAACKLGERIRGNAAANVTEVAGKPLKTTISVGVTEFRPGEDLEQLVSRVEGALQEAKAKGRNCVVCAGAA